MPCAPALRACLNEGALQNATHLIVVFDAWDDQRFPLFVHPGQNPTAVARQLQPGVQTVVYCLEYPKRQSRDLQAVWTRLED